ncbi:MAG: hypothetical protein ACTSPM_08110 [Candidatus Heimdallarchaeota archaeon]
MKKSIIEQDNYSLISKVVTIRDLDKELFERFSSLTKAWGKNTGTIFTNIIKNFLARNGSNVYLPPLEDNLRRRDFKHLELIENEEELIVSKKDLTLLPDNVKFYFSNIKKLVIAEDIDTVTLLKYVYRIKNSTVVIPDSIDNILFLSLLQNHPQYQFSNREVKDVTIRNVNEQAWNDFTSFCQINRTKIGTLASEILWEIIPEMEITQILLSKIKEPIEDIIVVSALNSAEIKHDNIKAISSKKILFHRINELVFQDDITNEDFLEKVVGIYNCQKIIFPKSVSKLLKLSRVHEYPGFIPKKN